jgi:hypothetical protein
VLIFVVHDAGVLQLGDPVQLSTRKNIPQGRTRFDFECPGDCTEHWEVPEINIFSQLLHMHQAGDLMCVHPLPTPVLPLILTITPSHFLFLLTFMRLLTPRPLVPFRSTEVWRNGSMVHTTRANFFTFDSMDTNKFEQYGLLSTHHNYALLHESPPRDAL